jgi:archaellin
MSLKGSVVGIAAAPAADPELGTISSGGGLVMMGSLILQAGSNPMFEWWADDTITVTLDAGVTGTATSGSGTVIGSPVALHAGVNTFATKATPGNGDFDITLVAPPAGPAGPATALTSVTFNLALAISGDSVDLNNLVINYWDSGMGVTALTLDKDNSGDPTKNTTTAGDWSYDLTDGSASSILTGTLEAVITVSIPPGATVGSYDTFTIQINPPTGASITIQRTLPPIAAVMTLN